MPRPYVASFPVNVGTNVATEEEKEQNVTGLTQTYPRGHVIDLPDISDSISMYSKKEIAAMN